MENRAEIYKSLKELPENADVIKNTSDNSGGVSDLKVDEGTHQVLEPVHLDSVHVVHSGHGAKASVYKPNLESASDNNVGVSVLKVGEGTHQVLEPVHLDSMHVVHSGHDAKASVPNLEPVHVSKDKNPQQPSGTCFGILQSLFLTVGMQGFKF
ncbi:uncharacterized protein A4U43_C03F19040 [Asparagus officinalis]|uniref:Uncharacterized protein n=1 Tax=Asparagus officinalis TaxID=4686 RepID=A0A5P1FC84_ASPOF|nr:uncharacterized protein A4U43_C03F19040 [Asparagus officinalis]